MESPQFGNWQVLVQPSLSTVLVSSHPSPVSTTLSPQTSILEQSATHPSPLTVLLSSQTSTPASTEPSPQEAATQVLRQLSVSSALASSQASPESTIPSPQVSTLEQSALHQSPLTILP